MVELYAGCATADITPPVGIYMGGYWERRSAAMGIRDRLSAKVLFFSCAGQSCALVALDLVAIDAEVVRRIRTRVAAEASIAAEAIMVCTSHTHASPLTMAFRGMGDIDLTYVQSVEDVVVATIQRAREEMETVELRYARVPVQIGVNRRRVLGVEQGEEELVIPYAHVVVVEGGSKRQAVLFSHACHPVVLGATNCEISGDFSGAAARYIEEEIRCPALFVNGACGDINPRCTNSGFAEVDVLGAELGAAVVGALAAPELLEVNELKWDLRLLQLPLIPHSSHLRAKAVRLVLKLKMAAKNALANRGNSWMRRVARARLEWADAALAQGNRTMTQAFSIQVLALGSLVLLGMEGEIFARYQLDIEARAGRTLVCGYANGCIGYVPTADEYARGGYEIDEAYKVYPSVRMIAPESEGLIRAAVAELLAPFRVDP
jgi:neutral ceramidase